MSSYMILTVISVYEIAYIGNYCSVAALSLAAYAWMESLGDEVTLVWSSKKKRTYATLVYALTRYATLAEYAVAIVPLGKLPLLSCEVVVWLQVVFVAASSLGAAAFSALRIYALSRSNRTLAALIFFLLLAPCVVDTVFNSKWIDVEELPSPFYCVRQSTASVELNFRLTTASRICAILADLIVAAATWMHAYKARHAHKLSSGPTLGQVMLYDGSMYFIVLASLNIIRIVFSSLAVDNVSLAASSIPIFTDLLGSLIISRFILDLRQANDDTNTPLSSLSFVDPHLVDSGSCDSLSNVVAPFSDPAHTAEADLCSEEFGVGRRRPAQTSLGY